jgi:predicted glycogen debranching enzyme
MTNRLIRRINISQAQAKNAREILRREWLLTNGLGGYASGTISGTVARRYHGLLVAALPAPLGRVVMLNHLSESVVLPDGRRIQIGGVEPSGPDEESCEPFYVREFRLEYGVPTWQFEVEGCLIEKTLVLLHGQNTVHVTYRLLSDAPPLRLELCPSLHFRPHEQDVASPHEETYALRMANAHYEVHSNESYPPLRLSAHGEHVMFSHSGGELREIVYDTEAERGYQSRSRLWSPGVFSVKLGGTPGEATFVVSTEPWPVITALSPAEAAESEAERRRRLLAQAPEAAREGPAAELVLAADQFIITPAGRVEDAARARASGDEVRTVIAGYHWFTDWGRDTMISLEGLTLATGRHHEAGSTLRTFAHYVHDGLIPNLFPEGKNEGLYHTADATLWFFHALDRYVEITGDRETLRVLLPKLTEIVQCHLRGTRFGIGVDPADGLLRQGAEGYQLTWMDAKVDGWVVTPRRGKAVEINALWYNALRLLEGWTRDAQNEDAAHPLAELAARAHTSFNQRFWSPTLGHLFDVVDGEHGDDPACRPNQILAIALRHPVLDEARWTAVLHKVKAELLTPVGLRSLARSHPDYKSRYFGDLRARDAAYHQGTVWAWLIGPFVDAWLKVHPEDRKGARQLLAGLMAHLDHACIGSISEIFDADEPYTPRGCIAQAWSVAEALRCWLKTA